jgi:probable addiction module antidote protein
MAKTSKFDAADYLKTPEQIAAYLTEALETADTAFLCTALDTIARAKGMSSVAKATGLARESLYKTLSGNSKPEFDTIAKVVLSFGVKLVAQPIEDETNAACAGPWGVPADLGQDWVGGRDIGGPTHPPIPTISGINTKALPQWLGRGRAMC